MQRPKSGELVWIEHQGQRQRAVYMVHDDMLLMGNGTRIPFVDAVPDGSANAVRKPLHGESSGVK